MKRIEDLMNEKNFDYKKHINRRNLGKIVSYITIFIIGFQFNSILNTKSIWVLTEKSFDIREEESFQYPFKVKEGELFYIKLYNLTENKDYRIYWNEDEGPLCFSWNLTMSNSSFYDFIHFSLRFYRSGWFGLATPGPNSTYEGNWLPVLVVYVLRG